MLQWFRMTCVLLGLQEITKIVQSIERRVGKLAVISKSECSERTEDLMLPCCMSEYSTILISKHDMDYYYYNNRVHLTQMRSLL